MMFLNAFDLIIEQEVCHYYDFSETSNIGNGKSLSLS